MEKFSKSCATETRVEDRGERAARMGRIASLRQDATTIAPPRVARVLVGAGVDTVSTPPSMSPLQS
ncbi:hypothetical protein [Sorangium sp. So ce394]|uniref:hypothetical protein n=1 Tax=Sorangium sp. So ce394 TaxID=3133310 RepID=UPI003F5C0D45